MQKLMSVCCIFHSFFDTNAKVQHSIYTVFFANTKKIQNLYIFVSKYESNLIFLLHVHVFYPPNARRLVPGGGVQTPQREETRTGGGADPPNCSPQRGVPPPAAGRRFSDGAVMVR